MELVIDANILFAALIKDGKTREIICNKKITLCAPNHLLVELNIYRKLIIEKSRAAPELIEEMIALLFDRVRIIQPERQYGAQAELFSPDPDDSAYFALALQLRCPLWSNDKRLKEQSEVHVLTTTELAVLLDTDSAN